MLKSYETRVRATYDLVVATLGYVNAHAGSLRAAVTRADAATRARAPGAELPVAFKTTEQAATFALKGFAFSQQASEISGDTWTTYDPKSPKTFEIPNYRDLVATASVRLPAAYAILPAWTPIVEKLAAHGIRTEPLWRAATVRAERYRLTDPSWDPKPFESHHRLRDVAIASDTATFALPEGTVLVPMDQPAANLVANLLEPAASDSLLRWGFFDAIFEQKESPDARVAERLAREMIDADPAIAAAFKARLAADPLFAKDPDARLAFFYERSPWYAAQRIGTYPVLRLDLAALNAARGR
jgi:hypothetical protein